MIVTTKKGKDQYPAKVGVTLENSFVQPMHADFVDGATWMDLTTRPWLPAGIYGSLVRPR